MKTHGQVLFESMKEADPHRLDPDWDHLSEDQKKIFESVAQKVIDHEEKRKRESVRRRFGPNNKPTHEEVQP